MARPALSVTLITLNEEANLPRALASVAWADEIIVVDSGSTDRTCEVARLAGARVFSRAWEGYGQQKNFAQDQATHDWILNLDADEEVSPALQAEIAATLEQANSRGLDAFRLPRKTWYLGRWILHGGWYPNHLVRLARKSRSRWTEPQVHEEWRIEGSVGTLDHPLLHYTFGCIEDQVRTNLKFSRLGYQELLKQGAGASLLKLLLKPWGKFIETYILKRGFLDGMAGFIISVNAAHSMFLKYAYFYDSKGKIPDADSGRR